MRNKGVAWMILVLISLATIATFSVVAMIGFQGNVAFRKRALEEEILNIGNEMETDARLLQQIGTLITWQVLHDVGRNYLLDDEYLFFADTYNHPEFVKYQHRIDLLPYWDVIPQERIMNDIEKASRNLLSNYLRNMTDFFEELNEHPANRFVGATRDVDACISSEAEFIDSDKNSATLEDKIALDLDSVTFEYRSNRINLIQIEAPIKTEIETDFKKIMNISQEAIDKLKEIAYPPSIPRGPVTIRNGESYDVDLGVLLSVKDKPTGLGPDLRLNIIPPRRESTHWWCCKNLKTNLYSWRSGFDFQCGDPKIEERAEVAYCAFGGPGDHKDACDSRCDTPDFGYEPDRCTCNYVFPPIRRIEFLKNKPEDQGAVGRKGSDCKDPSLPYFSYVDVNNGETFCLRTKEFDVKPSCIKEVDPLVDRATHQMKVLNSQDSKCELHTATFRVSIVDPDRNFDNITIDGNYQINTIIQEKHAIAVEEELRELAKTTKYNFAPNIDIRAHNGTNWVRITEENSKQVPLFIYGKVVADNIGLEFLVDTEIEKWTMKPPKYKLDQIVWCYGGNKPFYDCARLAASFVDTGLAFRSDSPVFRWMYAQAKEFIC